MNQPKVENAPGLVWRERKDGWSAWWQCRSDLAKRGFRPRMVPLFRGTEPSVADIVMMQDQCNILQAQMLVWGHGGLPEVSQYDGTIASLIRCYQTDQHSPYRKNRFRTRENYRSLCRRIEADHGAERIEHLRGRDMVLWHEEWQPRGIPMAHSLMRMVRILLGFGLSLLDCEQCGRMCAVLGKQRFEMGGGRESRLTAEMAIAIRAEAHKAGLPEIALAQALQFEGTFRQKDVIGEWVPQDEPGVSDVTDDGDKWLRGIRWNEIDENLILRHVTSKKQKMVEVDLKLCPMVVEEFTLGYSYQGAGRSQLPTSGPMVIGSRFGRPYRAHHFRDLWRSLARAAGIPDHIRSMDTRAGAISEATDAGASLELTRHAAAHSNSATTAKYSRGSADKVAEVLKLRVAHRSRTK